MFLKSPNSLCSFMAKIYKQLDSSLHVKKITLIVKLIDFCHILFKFKLRFSEVDTGSSMRRKAYKDLSEIQQVVLTLIVSKALC